MKNLRTFESFSSERAESAQVNEGLFDKLSSMFSKISGFFSTPDKLKKAVDATMTDAGDKSKSFVPKMLKTSETYMVVMGDGKNSATDFSIGFSKLADLPDGSGLFQITGTTSPEMLKALIGTDKNEDLTKENVMALIPPNGLEKGKVATMRLVKNITPGKDYVTKSLVLGSVPALDVEKKLANLK